MFLQLSNHVGPFFFYTTGPVWNDDRNLLPLNGIEHTDVPEHTKGVPKKWILCFHSQKNNIYVYIKSGSICHEAAIYSSREHGSAQGLVVLLWHHNWYGKDARLSVTSECPFPDVWKVTVKSASQVIQLTCLSAVYFWIAVDITLHMRNKHIYLFAVCFLSIYS